MNTEQFFAKRAEFRAKYFPKQEPVKYLGLRPELRRLRQDFKRLKKKFRTEITKQRGTGYTYLNVKDFNYQRRDIVQVAQAVRASAHQRYLDKYAEA